MPMTTSGCVKAACTKRPRKKTSTTVKKAKTASSLSAAAPSLSTAVHPPPRALEPWHQHLECHNRSCRADLFYRLLFATHDDDDDDLLSSHVNGLVARANCAEPGILVATYGETAWSSHMLETLDIIKDLPSHPALQSPEHRHFRRMIYHAVIFVCLPHVATFTEYVAKNSENPHKLLFFVEKVLVPSECDFFYTGVANIQTLVQWVAFLRMRWIICTK